MNPRAELLLACQEARDAFIKVVKLCRHHELDLKLRGFNRYTIVDKTDVWLTRLFNLIENRSAKRWPNGGQPSTPDATVASNEQPS